jgi:hypothetical protein
VSALLLLAAASLCGCATPIVPAAAPSPAAQLAALPEPDRLWIRDTWSGLGPSYELWAVLVRVGATYEAECALRVFPLAPDGRSPPPRAEARSIVLATAPVHAFVEAVRHAAPELEAPGLVHLGQLDDTGEAEVVLFSRARSGPVYLAADPGHRFSVALDRRYRLRDHEEAHRAYLALLAALGLYPWVEAVNRAALGAAAPESERP